MATRWFQVSITPDDVYRIVGNWDGAELLHHESKGLGTGHRYAALVFEKYFFRNKSRAGLVVLCDDIAGFTEVRIVSTGSGDGMFLPFDWGAGDSFVNSVMDLLDSYIVGEVREE